MSPKLRRSTAFVQTRMRRQRRMLPNQSVCQSKMRRSLSRVLRIRSEMRSYQSQSHLQLSRRANGRSVPELPSHSTCATHPTTSTSRSLCTFSLWTQLDLSSRRGFTILQLRSRLHRNSSKLQTRMRDKPRLSQQYGVHQQQMQRSVSRKLWC